MSNAELIQVENYELIVGDRGRVVLPVGMRKRLNLKRGDHLHVHVDADNNIQIIDLRRAVDSICGILTQYTGGKPIVDEFLQDRRREAASE